MHHIKSTRVTVCLSVLFVMILDSQVHAQRRIASEVILKEDEQAKQSMDSPQNKPRALLSQWFTFNFTLIFGILCCIAAMVLLCLVFCVLQLQNELKRYRQVITAFTKNNADLLPPEMQGEFSDDKTTSELKPLGKPDGKKETPKKNLRRTGTGNSDAKKGIQKSSQKTSDNVTYSQDNSSSSSSDQSSSRTASKKQTPQKDGISGAKEKTSSSVAGKLPPTNKAESSKPSGISNAVGAVPASSKDKSPAKSHLPNEKGGESSAIPLTGSDTRRSDSSVGQ